MLKATRLRIRTKDDIILGSPIAKRKNGCLVPVFSDVFVHVERRLGAKIQLFNDYINEEMLFLKRVFQQYLNDIQNKCCESSINVSNRKLIKSTSSIQRIRWIDDDNNLEQHVLDTVKRLQTSQRSDADQVIINPTSHMSSSITYGHEHKFVSSSLIQSYSKAIDECSMIQYELTTSLKETARSAINLLELFNLHQHHHDEAPPGLEEMSEFWSIISRQTLVQRTHMKRKCAFLNNRIDYYKLTMNKSSNGAVYRLKHNDLLHCQRLEHITSVLCHIVQAARRTRSRLLEKQQIEQFDCIARSMDDYINELEHCHQFKDDDDMVPVKWLHSTIGSTRDGRIIVSVVPRLLFQLQRFYSLIQCEIDYFSQICNHIDALSSSS